MLTLSITHNIFLTKEERYRLHQREPVETMGVSLPVWFYRGNTSEPAQEVFCKYFLTNKPENSPIVNMRVGYQINMPQKQELPPELQHLPPHITQSLGYNQEIMTTQNLLDVQDGGGEWLYFRQYNKVRKNRRVFNVVHFVEIKPIEKLMETLTL